MLRYINISIFWILITSMVVISCDQNKDESIPELSFVQPDNFPTPTYTFNNNKVSGKKFELGKRLFFDPVLSKDNSVSCASCHVQTVAFADPQHRLSVGINGKIGERNAPAIQNLAFMNSFFWDGGVTHMDFISINPIENPLEMAEDIGNVVKKLNQNSSYTSAFSAAFDTDTVTTPFLLQALSQYMLQLVSSNSPYDKYVRNEDKSALNSEQLEGMKIFEAKCASCHAGALFTDQSFRNNGIDKDHDKDLGRETITEDIQDRGKFKVPSLRNIELTSPYMHDGRFNTLDEVLEHYKNGVVSSNSLDTTLVNGNRLGIEITDTEKEKVISFLKSLTDKDFINNPLLRQ